MNKNGEAFLSKKLNLKLEVNNLKLGMKFFIDYAHSLEAFSKCKGIHGHTAKVIIEIEGHIQEEEDDSADSIILPFEQMREKCKTVLKKLDHQNLNEMFKHPTTEVITKWIFDKLSKKLPVSRVTFYEGKGKWATVESQDV